MIEGKDMIVERCAWISCVFLGAFLGTTWSFAEDVPRLDDLRQFKLYEMQSLRQQVLARTSLPLHDPKVSQLLYSVMARASQYQYREGVEAVLYSHGTEGFLWGLEQLARNDSVHLRVNLAFALWNFDYRELYLLYISLLDDNRILPIPPLDDATLAEFRKKGFIPVPPEKQRPTHVRCLVFHCLCSKLAMRKEIPEQLKDKSTIQKNTSEAEIDEYIAAWKVWWAKEGERYITATRPSVVEVLLKEAEEKAKKEAGGKAKGEAPKAEDKKESPPKPPEPKLK